MKIRNYFLIAVGGAVIGAASGFAWRAFDNTAQNEATNPVKTVQEVDTLPHFTYPDLDGRVRNSGEFADKVVVLNFWATWCPPCRKETPEFVALQETFADNVQFVGIAIDDAEPVREFADSFGVNYPVLLGDIDAVTLSRRLGNRYEGLPFTVVTAPGGKVVMRHAGGLERDQLEPLLRRLAAPG
ncbi:MAG: TlpA family protein disulfide reductase [Chromatiaceae bacterium]|nr:TlpA family protein disulfide reductase [Gammaproteobacteria bacterium]MCP5305395.1 TlpA family protein disulfide reductase [Chromatiaceae bacterium]MCP5315354.1 TlpA family protein disulfide reductase [Chromatiaceae bacterium]